MAIMHDKRFDRLLEDLAEREEQIRKQAQIIINKDAEIRKLESEIGILQRTVLIAYDRLSKASNNNVVNHTDNTVKNKKKRRRG